MWCLISLVAMALLGAICALLLRLPQVNLRRPHPVRLLRGCIALLFLLAAVVLAVVAIVILYQP